MAAFKRGDDGERQEHRGQDCMIRNCENRRMDGTGRLARGSGDRRGSLSVQGNRLIRDLKQRFPLLGFQSDWIKAVFQDHVQIGAMSLPRGSGKSQLFGWIASECLRPGSALFHPGIESLIVSGSLEQSRVMLGFLRQALHDDERSYRICDSSQRMWILHRASNTRIRVLSSSGKRAMGLAQFGLILCDEPGSWEARGGQLLWQALTGSLGKREGQKVLVIGTRSPAEPGSWWLNLLEQGSGSRSHVMVLAADKDQPWDAWETIRAVNPLILHNPSLRQTILHERDEARKDESLRPAFEAYRLNRSIQAHTDMLVQVEDWQTVETRPVPDRHGRPIVGFDVGASRAWTAAWCLWSNGRTECYALAPGIPDLKTREKQDAMPTGMYRRLQEQGALIVDKGLRMARAVTLIDYLLSLGIVPQAMYADRFLFESLNDVVGNRWPLILRPTRWSASTEDITAFRRLVFDGPLSIAPESRDLARVSLGQAVVVSEDANLRVRKSKHGRSRDDVAVGGTLACGALARHLAREPNRPQRKLRYHLVTAA